MGVIYETSIWAFFFVTVLAGGGAAFMIGRAAAQGWKPFWQAGLYALLLAAAVRFLHWGLFAGATLASWREAQGSLFSLHYYAADAAVLLAFTALGFRLKRGSQMLHQYGWLIVSAGPFGWRIRQNATTQP
jgi:hypothetical protein